MNADPECRPSSQSGITPFGTRRQAEPSDTAARLPPDFEWRPYVNGPALYLRERLVASAAQLEPGFGYRVAINPDSIGRRYVFLATEDAVRRYCEMWATRYQDRLRAGE